MNRSISALPPFLLIFALAFGQQKEPPTTTIKRRADLVLVPAVVTLDGKPVKGLTAKDFVLLHNGQPERVEVFEELDATLAKVEHVTLPPRTVQNYATADSHQDIVILFLDYLNSSWSTRARIRSYLRDMARQFAEARTPVSVFLLSHQGLVQLHSFTGDLENLGKAIEQRHSGIPAVAESFSTWSSPFAPMGTDQTRNALHDLDVPPSFLSENALRQAVTAAEAIQQICEAYRGIPGRKKLIWMSVGFPGAPWDVFSDSNATRTAVDSQSANKSDSNSTRAAVDSKIAEKLVLAWKSLSNANIVVYPIDSNGVVNPSWEDRFSPAHGSAKFMAPVSLEVPTNTPSLLEVAEKTGGRVCTTLPTRCVQKILADGTHYYVLGFYLHGDDKPGWHKLKVTVNQSKLDVRSRNGFAVGAGTSAIPASDNEEVMTALLAPLDYTSVPLRLKWSALPAQGKDTQVELALVSPPGGIAFDPEESRINVDYLAFVRPIGKTEGQSFPVTLTTKLSLQQQKTLATSGFRFRKHVTLAPGRYEVRVLLRDNIARKMGTVSTTIDLIAAAAPASGKTKP